MPKAVTPKFVRATAITEELERLRDLRRRLCCYVNSDSFCDCKRLVDPETLKPYTHTGLMASTGEHTGCCEVRTAITLLEAILSPTSIKTKSSAGPLASRSGRYGNCQDCGCPLEDLSACFTWYAPPGVVDVCCTCDEKRHKEIRKGPRKRP